MGHLSAEALARLVSEDPSLDEENHLESCLGCREELKALQEQTEALGALPDLMPPAGDWEALEARLLSDGLIHSSGLSFPGSRWRIPAWLQAAAALVLFLGGTALGTRFSGDSFPGGFALGDSPPGVELVPVGSEYQPADNLTDAAAAVRLAERQYIDALVQYRQILDAQGEPSLIGDPASRFAALEGIVAAGRAAVQTAPADPFVNGVLVSALAEREAILRNASLTRGDGVF